MPDFRSVIFQYDVQASFEGAKTAAGGLWSLLEDERNFLPRE